MDNAKILPGVLCCPVAALLQSFLVSIAPGMPDVQPTTTHIHHLCVVAGNSIAEQVITTGLSQFL